MATKTADEIKAEVEAGTADLANSVAQDVWEAPVGPSSTTITVDSGTSTTDNTVHIPPISTSGGASAGQIWVQGGGTSPGDIFITDDTGTDYNLSGLWENNADLTIGNLRVVVKDNGEMVVTLDGVEYHFSKNKVKSFLEKFADARVEND